ncbi:MAG TPA: ABC transporter ATP-binding protein [Pyrinomonadaceae bacterium]|jgi:ABC-type Fe3+/spermidine/putrescine transport system ATPase subunit|nr:ABC transporter ATP-binding protein [Pyrinomonadaceae bacterium]
MTQSTEKNQIAVSVEGLSKKFGETVVLEDINFHVKEGETIVLLGASGSGKTTILRIIAGLEKPDSGRVTLHSKDVTNLPARERGVGVIFQSYALFPKMNVEHNIGYGLRLRGKPKADIKEIVNGLIELTGLEEHRRKSPSQLSGGQQQRVAIARALAYNPEVLLFDEPFGALDAQIRTRLRREIRALLREIKVPSIFITHDQEEALELGDRIAVLNQGRLEQIGTPFDVYNKPATEYVATFLGAANLLLGIINEGKFEAEDIFLQIDTDANVRDGQSVKLVFRPEDVFLRKPENLTQNYQLLTDGFVEEVNFVGAFERVVVRLNISTRQPIIVTRPKTETTAFPLEIGQKVTVGLVRFRILPNYTLASERASRVV